MSDEFFNRVEAVICLGCRQRMKRIRPVAIVQWTNTTPTVEMLYECETPDCGTSVTIEEDYSTT